MAHLKYQVQRGDTLWGICSSKEYGPSIAGSNIPAKIETICKLNNIINANIIMTGQWLILSENGSSGSSATTTPTSTPTSTAAKITGFGLNSIDETGRELIAVWEWEKSGTAGFSIQWTYYNPIQDAGWVMGETKDIDNEGSDHLGYFSQFVFSPPETATKVSFRVRPYYKKTVDNKEEKVYWDDVVWSDRAHYDYSDNPPLVPPVPKEPDIDDLTLTITIDGIDSKKLDAVGVQFNIVKDNQYSIDTTGTVPITKDPTTGEYLNYVSYRYTKELRYGSLYKVRARSVSAKGKVSGWSSFSSNKGTKPSAPSEILEPEVTKKDDGSIAVHLQWGSVATATEYLVEYTTNEEHFDNPTGEVAEVSVKGKDDKGRPLTSVTILNMAIGSKYYFRVKAIREIDGAGTETSDPSPVVKTAIGTPPAAPTTWSSANSAFEGETMEFNWIHNASDNSRQTCADVAIKINDGNWHSYTYANTTTPYTGDRIDRDNNWSYGAGVSYKGNLYFQLDTRNIEFKNAKIQWKVRTAGITESFDTSDDAWSVPRTVYVYEKPDLLLSMVPSLDDVNDPDATSIETLESFPFYVRAKVDLDSYEIQRPVGYYLRVTAQSYYETIDDEGRVKVVNAGDDVYSKYFDTSETLLVEMTANNIDLASGIPYTLRCTADMSTGLTIDSFYEFSVSWLDLSYILDATIDVDTDTYTAIITPRCTDAAGNLVENTTVSVYRREYDGTYMLIAKDVPNNGTSITDPHPALDYARYRLIARDTNTGAISFYDMSGYPVNGPAIIIQWDEEWTTFDVSDETVLAGPSWAGSMLKLMYDISVSDSRKREVELVKYAGREHPVSYYGTQREETSTWTTNIPKDDKETIYALRRLSLWSGDVYVREPSGIGYWASISVSFNLKEKDLTVPVTINITRVEGGM